MGESSSWGIVEGLRPDTLGGRRRPGFDRVGDGVDPVSPKRQRVREAWRAVLQRLADRLPDPELPPPVDVDDDGEDDERGSEIPSLTSEPIPPRG